MREIIISNPIINNDPLRDYSYHDEIAKYALPKALELRGIIPTSHPTWCV